MNVWKNVVTCLQSINDTYITYECHGRDSMAKQSCQSSTNSTLWPTNSSEYENSCSLRQNDKSSQLSLCIAELTQINNNDTATKSVMIWAKLPRALSDKCWLMVK